MDKSQNESGKIFSKEFGDELINIKEEKDLMKSFSSPEINPIITIKELINSLKEKINIYEKQIKKLIDDKVKLQMEMNEMILQNLQSKKKNSNNNIENISNKENSISINNLDNKNLEKEQNKIIVSSLIDINQKLIEQNKDLKEQLEIYKKNLDIYKQKMNDIKNKPNTNNTNNNINEINNNKKCPFCEEKKIELSKMAEEKKEIFSSITSLRKQLDELKLSEKIKKEKKKKREKIKKTESLPNIEQYFILNNKFQLVDSDKNLWHMKKCLRFQEFKKQYENTNLSSDDILKEFVDAYDSKLDEEKSEDNDYLDALNMSANESEDIEHKKNENKYMPPLPGIGNNYKKKGNKNNEVDNENKNQEINNSDIQINIDENEENKKDGINDKNKNEEKKIVNNEIENVGNLNEIKEETSFNLSDNTD